LFVRHGADQPAREQVFQRWLRQELRLRAAPLIEKWAKSMEVSHPLWGIKQMKTKWGSCNSAAGRIWLNLELVKKPPQCLEYAIVHELTHLRVRNHDEHFVAMMDNLLPQWRLIRDELNAEPLAHEEW
jgi:predicted metal-dependent hydrolase